MSDECKYCKNIAPLTLNGPGGDKRFCCEPCFDKRRKELKKQGYKVIFSDLDLM